MSRCYPFPPPGYGKKVNNDDLGLLTKKEKHKHKKEKKDKSKEKRKKNKDKKEGTEKREKERDRKEEQTEYRQKDDYMKEEETERREKNKGQKDKDHKDRKDKGKQKDIDRSREKDINKEKKKDKDREKDGFQDKECPREKHVDKGVLHYQDGNRVNQWEKGKERDNQWYKIMGKDKQSDKDWERDMNKVKNRDIDGENVALKDRERITEKYVENGRFKDMERDGINRWGKSKDRDKQWDTNMAKQIGKEWDNVLDMNEQRDEQCGRIMDRDTRRDNCEEGEWKDDRDMGNGSEHKGRKKRKEINTNGNLHGIGLWIHLPVLTDKDKLSNKLPRIALDKEVHTQKGSEVRDAKDVAAVCTPDGRTKVGGNADIEMHVASTDCHPSSCRKSAETNGMIDFQPSLPFRRPLGSHTDVPDVAPLMAGTDAHVLDLRHTENSSPKQCWSEVDDQDWLFHGNSNHLHWRPKATVEVDQGSSTVWAQALYIQSTDIHALPYVLPY